MLDGVESHTQSLSQYQCCREPFQSKGRFSQASHQTPGNGVTTPWQQTYQQVTVSSLWHFSTDIYTFHIALLGAFACHFFCLSGCLGRAQLQLILKTIFLGSLEGCAIKPTQMFEKTQGLLLPEEQLKIYNNCKTRISYMYKNDCYLLKCILLKFTLQKYYTDQ